jgi:YggT family protein
MGFIASFIDTLATVLFVALIGRVIISWLNIGPSSPFFPIANILYQVTEPILAPLRRVLPKFGMLDLSPMVAIILITVVREVVRGLT